MTRPSLIVLLAIGPTLAACGQGDRDVDGISAAVLKRAAGGSKDDIEIVLRRYESCDAPLVRDRCSKELDRWADLGARYGQIGALTMVINRDIGTNDCAKLQRLHGYVAQLQNWANSANMRYKYTWDHEKITVESKIKRLCSK